MAVSQRSWLVIDDQYCEIADKQSANELSRTRAPLCGTVSHDRPAGWAIVSQSAMRLSARQGDRL
jgi:hypothetical protein